VGELSGKVSCGGLRQGNGRHVAEVGCCEGQRGPQGICLRAPGVGCCEGHVGVPTRRAKAPLQQFVGVGSGLSWGGLGRSHCYGLLALKGRC
jgi:hypothetical protein